MPSPTDPTTVRSADGAIRLTDFYAVPTSGQFLFMPTRELWPGAFVDSILPGIRMPYRRNGTLVVLKPTVWLKRYGRVEQLTWLPGGPEIIIDRLISDGGWQERQGVRCLNLYHPPELILGDAGLATPWVDHCKRLYPDDVEHIIGWLAHRVQLPGQKPNHALVLGGGQGIGKDTLLAPLKLAVGAWNFLEISPTNLLEPFNPFVKAVILRMSEAHDLGDSERANRYALYERTKIYAATPPEMLRCNEKHMRQYYIPNVLGLVITTNHKSDGVYLPSDDRRHYVAWSHCKKEEFDAAYFNQLWGWLLYEGGNAHVAAYLAQRDLTTFDSCALPQQTPAFFDIVNAGRAPEDAELADALDELKRPAVVSIALLAATKAGMVLEWLLDRRQRRALPHRMERSGYIACRNPDRDDGLWSINARRQTLYARTDLTPDERQKATRAFVLKAMKAKGTS